MNFSVQKIITQKKQSPLKGLINTLILIIAIPVIAIAGISLSFYFLLIWLRNFIIKEKNTGPEDPYHLEFDLINNEYIHIILVEDELDTELTTLNEAWQEKVYSNETCLYRTRTIPIIPGLEGGITAFYYKEQGHGLILQVILPTEDSDFLQLNSRLIFLDYNNFHINIIDETGPFFLYNDDKNERLIKGFNKQEKLSIELVLPANSN